MGTMNSLPALEEFAWEEQTNNNFLRVWEGIPHNFPGGFKHLKMVSHISPTKKLKLPKNVRAKTQPEQILALDMSMPVAFHTSIRYLKLKNYPKMLRIRVVP